jgi:hypothetical protein
MLVIAQVFALFILNLPLPFFHPTQLYHVNFYTYFIHLIQRRKVQTTILRLLVGIKMPMTWDANNSMQMLLLLIAEADVKPSTALWKQVASKLGDITPGAVRYDLRGALRTSAVRCFDPFKS